MINSAPEQNYLEIKLALDASMDGIAILDAEGNYTYLNQEHLSIFGYQKQEELLGKSWQVLYAPGEIQRIQKEIFPVLVKQKKWRGETTGISKTGTPVPQEISLTMLEHGGMICICRDTTTERKKIQELKLHHEILATTRSMIILTDPEGKIEWVNKSFCSITGYELHEISGKKPGSFLQGKDSDQKEISKIRTSIQKKEPFYAELLNYKKDGTPYWIEIKGQPIFNEQGVLEHFFAIEEDITESKETQKQLEESERRYRKSIEASGLAIWEWDLLNNEIFATQEFRKLFGMSANENRKITYEILIDLVHPDDVTKLNESFQKHFSGGTQVMNLEYRFKRFDTGQYEWYQLQGAVIEKTVDQVPVKAVGYSSSIHERKMMEFKLKESEERWFNAMVVSGAGFWEYDLGKKKLFFSVQMKRILGHVNSNPVDENINYWKNRVHREDIGVLENIILSPSDAFTFECRILDQQNEYRWISASGICKFSETGRPVQFSGAAYDVTEKKNAEQAIIKARKMAESSLKAKRIFLANVSHEIRTPMHAIMGLSEQLVLSDLKPEQSILIRMINESSKSLMHIINDVLDLSKIEEGKLMIDEVVFDPNKLIRQTFDLFFAEASKKAIPFELHLHPENSIPFIGDPARIRQIFSNIISNAIKFTETGKITIDFEIQQNSPEEAVMSFVCTDTGIGMSLEMKKRIFEEFVQEDESFHRKYGGSGLGLSITHELVKIMKGTIKVESEKNKGTAVHITIPLKIIKDNKELKAGIQAPRDLSGLQNIKVLVAEDNEFNRLLLKFIFEKNHIPFAFAFNGRIAVEMTTSQQFDLILMDIQMPEMDGIEATQILRKKYGNDIPIIAVTANAVKEELEYYLKNGFDDYLTKPFEERRLLDKMLQHVN